VLPTDLPNLTNRIAKRKRAEYRMQLKIATAAQAEESANALWSELEDRDESYINKPYNKASVDLFKNQVLRNRSFSK
jgi:hypothetical protein